MRTGSPAFGTPESVLGILAGAQLARRYGLPFRGGGGARRARTAVDAQAAAETADDAVGDDTSPRTDVVLHAAGWLEGGLTASFEKFALDVELLAPVPGAGARDRVQRGGARVRRAEGGRPRRAVPVVAAHTRALQGVALHVAAVHDARLRDLGGEGSRDHRGRARTARGSSCSRPTRTPASTRRSTRSSGRTWRAAATLRICSSRTEPFGTSTRSRPLNAHPRRSQSSDFHARTRQATRATPTIHGIGNAKPSQKTASAGSRTRLARLPPLIRSTRARRPRRRPGSRAGTPSGVPRRCRLPAARTTGRRTSRRGRRIPAASRAAASRRRQEPPRCRTRQRRATSVLRRYVHRPQHRHPADRRPIRCHPDQLLVESSPSSDQRKQCATWSCTMPVACMKA